MTEKLTTHTPHKKEEETYVTDSTNHDTNKEKETPLTDPTGHREARSSDPTVFQVGIPYMAIIAIGSTGIKASGYENQAGVGVEAIGGTFGVLAESKSGRAIRAWSPHGTPVEAEGGDVGVDASATEGGGKAIKAVSTGFNSTGVFAKGLYAGVEAEGGTVGVVARGPTAVFATGASIGVRATVTKSGTGVFGTSVDGTGVAGSGSGQFGVGVSCSGTLNGLQASSPNGNGVYASANGKGVGVIANSDDGLGGEFHEGKAPIRLAPATTAGAPNATTGAHKRGELYVDANGQLFFCTVDGTPGTWKRVRLDNL